MDSSSNNIRDFDASNASHRIQGEGFAGYPNPSPYQRTHAMQPLNALPPLHRAESQIHLPPPSPYMPPPSQVHPSFSRPPTTQALPDPRSAHATAVGSQQFDVPRLPEYDDLPPLPSLLNRSTIPSRNDEIEVVDTPIHTSTAGNRRRKPNETRNRPSPPANDTKRGGRNLGSKGFSMPEDGKVVDCVEEVQPIGGDGWEKVTVKYNTWAKEKGYPERTVQSLKKRFERINEKNEGPKPTGSGERGALLTRALNAQKEIEGKSGKDEVGLQTDYSDDEADGDPNEADNDEDGAAGDVKREVKEEEAGGKQGKQTKKGLKAGLEDTVKVEKDYKSKKKGKDEDTIRRRNGTAAATDALVGFREYVSPEREARRNAAAMQMMQVDFLQNETARLQSEIQQLRDRIDTLRDNHFREVTQLNNTIIQERERANRAETELRLVQMQLQMGMMGMSMGGYPRFGGYTGSRGEVLFHDRRCRRSPSPLERHSSPAKRPRTRSPSPEKSETATAVEVTLSPSKGSPSRRLSVKMDSLN